MTDTERNRLRADTKRYRKDAEQIQKRHRTDTDRYRIDTEQLGERRKTHPINNI